MLTDDDNKKNLEIDRINSRSTVENSHFTLHDENTHAKQTTSSPAVRSRNMRRSAQACETNMKSCSNSLAVGIVSCESANCSVSADVLAIRKNAVIRTMAFLPGIIGIVRLTLCRQAVTKRK